MTGSIENSGRFNIEISFFDSNKPLRVNLGGRILRVEFADAASNGLAAGRGLRSNESRRHLTG
jgi:hypothetical protein